MMIWNDVTHAELQFHRVFASEITRNFGIRYTKRATDTDTRKVLCFYFLERKWEIDEWSCVYVSDHLIASRANVTFSIQTYIKTYKLISHNDRRLARINNDHRCRKAEQRERKSRLIQWNRTPNSA